MARSLEAIVAELGPLLADSGLELRGWFAIEASDIPAGVTAVRPEMAVLLVGNAGPAMWTVFEDSIEHDGDIGDPMDRWTERIVHSALGQIDETAVPLFPFGADVWPFQRFAVRAMGLRPSPLGILIHPQFGLWHALRAAIAFPEVQIQPQLVRKPIHPCEACNEKPCLSACPVNAFSRSGFDVRACRSYLDSSSSSDSDSGSPRGLGRTGPDCMSDGCAARNACPVGVEYRYSPEQLRFHMAAFRGA
jgi:hypothetical protein